MVNSLEFDLIICGSGLAGLRAAISAAKKQKPGKMNLTWGTFIKEATAIFNLKVNYGWIDKQQIEQHQTNIDLSNLSTEEIKALLKDE